MGKAYQEQGVEDASQAMSSTQIVFSVPGIHQWRLPPLLLGQSLTRGQHGLHNLKRECVQKIA